MLILFFNYKLLSIFLPAKEVGLYFLMLSISSYIGLVLINPIGTYITRQLYFWKQNRFLSHSLIYFSLYALACHLVIFPILYFISRWLHISESTQLIFIAFSILYSLTQSLGNTFLPALNILNQRVSFVVLTALVHICGLGVSILLVTKFKPTSYFWLAGLSSSYFLFGLIAFFLIQKESVTDSKIIKRSYPSLNIKEIFNFASPILVTNFFMWMITQSYRPLTEQFSTLEFLGYAGFGLSLASTLSVTFEYLLQQLYFPDYYKDITSEDKVQRESAWSQIANQSLPIYFSVAAFVSIMSPFIIRFTASQEYQAATYFLAIGIWAETFRSSNNIFSLIGHSEMKTSRLITPYLWGGVITVGLLVGFYFFNCYETALPFTLLLGNFTVTFFLYQKFRNHFKIEIKLSEFAKRTWTNLLFLFTIPFYTWSSNIWTSFSLLTISGLLFLWFQYKGIKSQ